MRGRRAIAIAAVFLCFAGCKGSGSGQSTPPFQVLGPSSCVAGSPAPLLNPASVDFRLQAVPGANGLPSPMDLQAPAGDARLFVAQRGGLICVVQNGVPLTTPFLDISARVTTEGEAGLISFAFDPGYASNGFVYVHFIENSAPNGVIVVERYTVSSNPNVLQASATTVIRIPHPDANNHYGGRVAFGPDGMLYLSTGDGGGGGNQFGHAQDDTSLLGKLLRLDVSALNPAQAPPYVIPPDNPTWSGRLQTRRENWAIGLRNPYRYAFDGAQLYIADVGQDLFEEVDVVPNAAGFNFGWSIMEGTHCFPDNGLCNPTGLVVPVYDYSHGPECAIIGGYVYRGSVAALRGKYLFSDLCTGWLRTLTGTATPAIVQAPTVNVGTPISFGQDGNNELYVLTGEDRVLKFVSP